MGSTELPLGQQAPESPPQGEGEGGDGDDLLALLRRRRVTRVYGPGEVPRAQIRQLLEAAYLAPSGGNRRPVRFCVADSRSMVDRCLAVSPGIYHRPAALILVCIDWSRSPHLSRDMPGDLHPVYLDAGAAFENILLAAEALNLGACPVMSYYRPSIRQVFSLPDNWSPTVMVAIGRRPDGTSRARKPISENRLEEVVVWDRSAPPNAGGDRPGSAAPPAPNEVRAALLEVLQFAGTAAHGNTMEHASYGPIRLLQCAQRIVRVLEGFGLTTDELGRFAEQVAEDSTRIQHDPELARDVAERLLTMVGDASDALHAHSP